MKSARYMHASGTVTDRVTDEMIPMVTGGYNSGELDSTEILLDGQVVCLLFLL